MMNHLRTKIFVSIALIYMAMPFLFATNTMDSELIYLVRNPKAESQKPPVIILLHGVGSNEKDLFSFAGQIPDKYLVISARAPITLSPGSYAWYHVNFSSGKPVFSFDEEEKSRNTIIRFIEFVKAKYKVDDQQVYLAGFSQGAIMSYSVALTRPDMVKGIAVMSGRLLEEIKPQHAPFDKLRSLKVFISHGLNDTTLPVQGARNAVEYLKTLQVASTYKEYAAGHEINNAMLADLIKWLE